MIAHTGTRRCLLAVLGLVLLLDQGSLVQGAVRQSVRPVQDESNGSLVPEARSIRKLDSSGKKKGRGKGECCEATEIESPSNCGEEDEETCVSFGGVGEVCGSDGQCVDGAICNIYGDCEVCGPHGSVCCASKTCDTGNICLTGNLCASCGGDVSSTIAAGGGRMLTPTSPFEPCCEGSSCDPGFVCAAGECLPCGGETGVVQSCCEGSSCTTGFVCAAEKCVPCGSLNSGIGETPIIQSCCEGSSCNPGFVCAAEECLLCGTFGAPCCSVENGSGCRDKFNCNNRGFCTDCGDLNEECCNAFAPKCRRTVGPPRRNLVCNENNICRPEPT